MCLAISNWLFAHQRLSVLQPLDAGACAAKALTCAVKFGQTEACKVGSQMFCPVPPRPPPSCSIISPCRQVILSHPIYSGHRKSSLGSADDAEWMSYFHGALLTAALDGNEEICSSLLARKERGFPRSALAAAKVLACRSALALPKPMLSKSLRHNLVAKVHALTFKHATSNLSESLIKALGVAAKMGHAGIVRLLLDSGPFDSRGQLRVRTVKGGLLLVSCTISGLSPTSSSHLD